MKRLLIAIAFVAIVCVLAVVGYYWTRKEANNKELILYGNVDVRQVDIGFRVPGQVLELAFEEGDIVSQGTLMARGTSFQTE